MADSSVEKLNLSESIKLMMGNSFWSFGGVERLSIPAVKVADASNGIRQQYKDEGYSSRIGSIPAICYPSLCACGCSFDAKMAYEIGKALGEECRTRHIAVLLGPGMNIKRNPLCGRNFEYISEDPVLSGKLGAAFIQGVQSTGVGSCVKHFALNNQETRRTTNNSVVDNKTLWELYLRNFEIAVKEGRPWVIMGAYNKLNGIYCCENSWLLNDVLRKEWGFDGTVISDWGGVNDIIDSFNAGLDARMPGGVNGDEEYILSAAKSGELAKQSVVRASDNIMKLSKRTAGVNKKHGFDKQKHLDIARQMAESSFVLLQNEDNVFPLKKESRILVVGEMAKHPRYQGSGSGKVKMSYAETPWEYLRAAFPHIKFEPGYDLNCEQDEKLAERALTACEEADTVLFFAGLSETEESEGFDRADMKLPAEHTRLIRAIARRNKNISVIVQGGSPMEMLWRDVVKGIILCYLPGSCFGSALTNILTGDVNPSGRLSETFPDRLADVPSYEIWPAYENAVYEEGIYAGYRYYNKYGVKPAFPFGHGLSYTSFEYSDITARLEDGRLKVNCFIENAGSIGGKEVVQIYIKSCSDDDIYRLAGFDKVYIEPGEKKEVVLELNPEYIAQYSEEENAMIFYAGNYEVAAGRSSAEMAVSTNIEVTSPSVYTFSIKSSSEVVFNDDMDTDKITVNTTLRDLEKHKILKPAIGIAKKMSDKRSISLVPAGKTSDLLMDTPLRQYSMGTNGAVKSEHIEKAVNVLNKIFNSEKKRKTRDGNRG